MYCVSCKQQVMFSAVYDQLLLSTVVFGRWRVHVRYVREPECTCLLPELSCGHCSWKYGYLLASEIERNY